MDILELKRVFMQSLNNRTYERCDEIIAQIERASLEEPSLVPYHLYFSATLLDERENNWDRAEKLYIEVLAFTSLPRRLHCDVLQSYSLLLRKQGLWNHALNKSREALAIADELDSADLQHKILVGEGIVYLQGFNAGDLGASALITAENCCRKALSCLTPKEKKTSKAAGAWNTLGSIYRELNRIDDAISCYQNLLRIGQDSDNEFYIAHANNSLGICYLYLEQWPQAIEAHHKALELFQNSHHRLFTFANLGYLHQNTAQYEQSLIHYDDAIALIEEVRRGLSTEEARTNFATTVADIYANAVLTCNAASKAPNTPKQEQQAYHRRAFNYMEQARARTFLELMHSDSSTLEQNFRADPLTIDQVQASLPEDALLLCFFTTGTLESPDARAHSGEYRRHGFPDDRIMALAVTKHEIHSHTSLLSPNVLYPQNRFGDIIREHFLAEGILRTLYFNLIKPLEALLADRRVLYIVPHGPLHYLPFQAMPTDDGQTLFNRHGPRIIYAPSASVLLRDRAAPEPVDAGAEECIELSSCLAIGYNGSGENRLLLAENEADRVAELTNGLALTGPQPKKDIFFKSAPTYRYLYFSCHGTFDVNNPLESALWLGEDEKLTAADVLENQLTIKRCKCVILSACQTGLHRVQRGDELYGLMRVFMIAGASQLILMQWKVDQWSTRVMIEEFIRHINSGATVAEALHQSQLTLRELTRDGVIELLSNNQGESVSEMDAYLVELRDKFEPNDKVFADPFYWASFILVGDTIS